MLNLINQEEGCSVLDSKSAGSSHLCSHAITLKHMNTNIQGKQTHTLSPGHRTQNKPHSSTLICGSKAKQAVHMFVLQICTEQINFWGSIDQQ